jgi:hypothetical protein
MKKGPASGPFFDLGVRGWWTNRPGFDKIAGSDFGARSGPAGRGRRTNGVRREQSHPLPFSARPNSIRVKHVAFIA